MLLQLTGAALLGFAISALVGKGLVPWLKKNGFVQPLKEEVAQIYTTEDNDSDRES